MDLSFNIIDVIGNYTNVIVHRSWNEIKPIIINVINSQKNRDAFQLNRIVWLGRDFGKAAIIEDVQELQDNKNQDGTLTITAKSLRTLLEDYITIPPAGQEFDSQTGTREQVVRAWVTNNMISPVDSFRQRYNIILGTLNNLGATITEQTRHTRLFDEVKRVLDVENLSYNISVNLANNSYTFDVVQGLDRTDQQSVNNRVFLGDKLGNDNSYKEQLSFYDYFSNVYVVGSGTGATQLVRNIKRTGNIQRIRETLVKDSRISAEPVFIERGNQVLADNDFIRLLEYELSNTSQFEYETDWDLGDTITSIFPSGEKFYNQIIEVVEFYENNNTNVQVSLGKPLKSFTDVLSGIQTTVSRMEST